MAPKALEGEIISPGQPSSNGHAEKPSDELLECFAADETVTIHLDRVQWVRLKKELDYGEEQELNTALVTGYSTDQLRAAAAAGQTITHTNSGRYMLMRVALYIDDWNVLGRDKTTVRLPRQMDERVKVIRRMSKPLAAIIEAKIAEIRGEGEPAQQMEASDESPLRIVSPTGSTDE